MSNMTAVEWLFDKMPNVAAGNSSLTTEEIFDQAKAMEREQILADVMLSLPTIKEIEAWAKEQAKIEPTGAEEFGRLWGAMWMRSLIEQKLKGNVAYKGGEQ